MSTQVDPWEMAVASLVPQPPATSSDPPTAGWWLHVGMGGCLAQFYGLRAMEKSSALTAAVDYLGGRWTFGIANQVSYGSGLH